MGSLYCQVPRGVKVCNKQDTVRGEVPFPTTALWDQATALLIATVQTLRKVKFRKPYIVYFLLIQTIKRTYFSIHLMQKHPKILMPVHIIQCLIGKVLLLLAKKKKKECSLPEKSIWVWTYWRIHLHLKKHSHFTSFRTIFTQERIQFGCYF